MEDLSAFSARPRLAALLDHFAKVEDKRQAWKVMYPLREVLFLVVCGTIASGDDYDDIVDWGEAHLTFLRGFAEFHFGIPCVDWLRCIMNRIDRVSNGTTRPSMAVGSTWPNPNSACSRRSVWIAASPTSKSSPTKSTHGRTTATSTTPRPTGNSKPPTPASS